MNTIIATDRIGDIRIMTIVTGIARWETIAFDSHNEEIDKLTCGGPQANALAMHKIMIDSINMALAI